jgi:hypothetical protein
VFSFIRKHNALDEVLVDHDLASLGDTYVNFVYSLALSNRRGRPSGAKVKGSVLAEAVRRAGLRGFLPARMTRHMLADAAEALMVYAWACGFVTLEENVSILEKAEDLVEGLCQLLTMIMKRARFS